MKIISSYNLEDKIRDALVNNCSSRCLDDEDDFEVVMDTVGFIINEWLKNRCEGCK